MIGNVIYIRMRRVYGESDIRDLAISPAFGSSWYRTAVALVIAYDNCALHCPKTFNFKLLMLIRGCVSLRSPSLYQRELHIISCRSVYVRLFLHWLDLGAANSYEKCCFKNPPMSILSTKKTNLALRRKLIIVISY